MAGGAKQILSLDVQACEREWQHCSGIIRTSFPGVFCVRISTPARGYLTPTLGHLGADLDRHSTRNLAKFGQTWNRLNLADTAEFLLPNMELVRRHIFSDRASSILGSIRSSVAQRKVVQRVRFDGQ